MAKNKNVSKKKEKSNIIKNTNSNKRDNRDNKNIASKKAEKKQKLSQAERLNRDIKSKHKRH